MIIFRVSSGYKPSRSRKIPVSIDNYYANLNANFLEGIATETDIQLKSLNNTKLQSVKLINLSHLEFRKKVFVGLAGNVRNKIILKEGNSKFNRFRKTL
jgi:hypothetical protein